MRLGKCLKVSQLIKRRTLAKEVGDRSRIAIDSSVTKTGSDAKVEDVLTIRFGRELVAVRVITLNEHASKDNAEGMYEVVEGRRLEEA